MSESAPKSVPRSPAALIGFVRQRMANMLARNSEGVSVGAWFISGVGRYATAYATELERRRFADTEMGEPELTAALSVSRHLNFGCGYDRREGFVNVDSDQACKPDVLIGLGSMGAFPTSFYQTIVAKDVLEHIPRLSSLRMLLLFNDWLATGGKLELQTSSILGVADLLRSRTDFSYHFGMVNCLFGSQMHSGDFHYTGFTETTLKVMLIASGFSFGEFQLVDGWMFKLDAVCSAPWYEWDDSSVLSEQEYCLAVFQSALGRGPNEAESIVFTDLLLRLGRRGAALEIFSSPERLLMIARLHGY